MKTKTISEATGTEPPRRIALQEVGGAVVQEKKDEKTPGARGGGEDEFAEGHAVEAEGKEGGFGGKRWFFADGELQVIVPNLWLELFPLVKSGMHINFPTNLFSSRRRSRLSTLVHHSSFGLEKTSGGKFEALGKGERHAGSGKGADGGGYRSRSGMSGREDSTASRRFSRRLKREFLQSLMSSAGDNDYGGDEGAGEEGKGSLRPASLSRPSRRSPSGLELYLRSTGSDATLSPTAAAANTPPADGVPGAQVLGRILSLQASGGSPPGFEEDPPLKPPALGSSKSSLDSSSSPHHRRRAPDGDRAPGRGVGSSRHSSSRISHGDTPPVHHLARLLSRRWGGTHQHLLRRRRSRRSFYGLEDGEAEEVVAGLKEITAKGAVVSPMPATTLCFVLSCDFRFHQKKKSDFVRSNDIYLDLLTVQKGMMALQIRRFEKLCYVRTKRAETTQVCFAEPYLLFGGARVSHRFAGIMSR